MSLTAKNYRTMTLTMVGLVVNSSIMEKKWQKVLKVSWSKDELSQID